MQPCEECGTLNAHGSRFCKQCGKGLGAVCHACGADLTIEARFCSACGAAVPPTRTPADASEERKLVSVLFADLVESTVLSEALDPEPLRTLLDAYFAAMAEEISVWGGTVEKFIGDAIVAVFGVPSAREDDPERALRAALGMLQRLALLNEELARSDGLTLLMRIGVNTGEVIATTTAGLDQRMVAGDAVNVAARLQSVAPPGGVMVGQRTYLAARGAFSFDDAQPLVLKGIAQPIQARRLRGALAEARRGVPGLEAPMVGRDLELGMLAGLLEDVIATQRPRLVTILGLAGVGKSRLVREFTEHVRSRQHDARLLRGRCLAAGHGITYWALAEILRSACDISLDSPTETSVEKLEAVVSLLLRSTGTPEPQIEETIFALATTAGLSLPGNPLSHQQPQAVADELSRAWARFISAWAAGATGILVVEDLHWADEALIAMLERIVARSTGAIMVVATARPEFADKHGHYGGGSEHFSTVSLRGLSDAQTAELVEALLQHAEMPDALRAAIRAKADGNPYFVEEIVRRLIEDGTFVHEGGGWTAIEAASRTPLPDSLHELLQARIDALTADQKRVLQGAAIVGRVFWEQPLARTAGDMDVRRSLLELETHGMIYARAGSTLAGQTEYIFKHALLRDVAYAAVPKARRARAHAQVGKWIEELARDRRAEFAELLAYHFEAASAGDGAELAWGSAAERETVRATALEHLMFAGAQARARYAISSALDLHARALAISSTDPERRRALEELGDDHDSTFAGESAVSAYRSALELAADRQDRARLLWKIAWLMASRPGAFRQNPRGAMVDEICAEGLALAPDEATKGRLLAVWAMAARPFGLEGTGGSENAGSQGDETDPIPIEERIQAARAAREIGGRLSDQELVQNADDALELVYGVAGRYGELDLLVTEQLQRVNPIRSRIEQAGVFRSAARMRMAVSAQFEEGLVLARRAHELYSDSNPHLLMHGTHDVLNALYTLGRWQELMPILDEHVAAFRQDPAVVCAAVRDGPVIGAIVCGHIGQVGRARELAALVGNPREDLETASAMQAWFAVESGDPQTALEIAMPKALRRNMYGPQHTPAVVEALVSLQDWPALVDFLPKARRQVDGNALLAPFCDRAEGLVASAAGRVDAAEEALRRGLAGFETLKVPFEVARTQERLGAVAGRAESERLLKAALATYQRLGAKPHAGRVVRALRPAR